MLVVRDVFQAKYGRGDELVALFKEIAGHWDQSHHPISLHGFRILTDASLDAQLAAISDDDLATPVDMKPVGLGQQTLGSFLTILLIHAGVHTGEIAVTKGLQGLKGYPF
jgi:hypothetical protein